MNHLPGRGCISVVFVSLLLALPSAAIAASPLRLVGSDLLGDEGRRALVAHAATHGTEVLLDLRGSLPGREALVNGRADVALLAHAPQLDGADNAAPELANFRRVPVAWVTAVILVPADNPITQVTYEQLAGVFGVSGGPPLRYWGDLGADESWAARAIAPAVVGRDHGLTLDFFVHAVLLDRPLQPGLPELNPTSGPGDHLVLDDDAMVLWPVMPPASSGARALLVTAVAGEVAFGPSAENISTGDYPLALPLELVFRAGAERSSAPVVRFFASDEGAAAVEGSLLVALPAGGRARLEAEFGR